MFNKSKIVKLQILFKHFLRLVFLRLFNPTVIKQIKNPKSIPVIIISYNQLYYLKQLIETLLQKGYFNIIVLDNNSTYPPLLNYFDNIDSRITLHKLKTNDGHLALWKQAELLEKYTKGYYVVTDPDIIPVKECPDDFLNSFRLLLDRAYTRTKA